MSDPTPPRWNALCDRLQGLAIDLFNRRGGKHDLRAAAPNWEGLTRHFFGEEVLYRPEIDRAARHLAAHGRPPTELSPGARYYLLFRMQCALDFLGMVFPPQAQDSPFPDLPSEWDDRRAIEWLLVDLWLRRHDHWLKLNAIGVFGPFPFYGTEPADPRIPQ